MPAVQCSVSARRRPADPRSTRRGRARRPPGRDRRSAPARAMARARARGRRGRRRRRRRARGLRRQHRLRRARRGAHLRRAGRAAPAEPRALARRAASARRCRATRCAAMMLLRAAVLATGRSGARAVVLRAAVRAAQRAACTRVIPARGSVGASGDLAPLAHLALGMIGEGDAEYRGETLPGGRGAARAPGSRRSCSRPRRGWRWSTARST